MMAWRGKHLKGSEVYVPGFLPHQSWVPRKPEDIGAEGKTLHCSGSYMLLYNEFEEGAARMGRKKYRKVDPLCAPCTQPIALHRPPAPPPARSTNRAVPPARSTTTHHRPCSVDCAPPTDRCDCISIVVLVQAESGVHGHPAYPHTIAVQLRGLEKKRGKQYLVTADSWFGGVPAALAVRQQGNHYIGKVKTNTALFPKDVLRDYCPVDHGGFIAYKAVVKGITLFAVGVRAGRKKVSMYITTCGTTFTALKDKSWTVWSSDGSGEKKLVTHRRIEIDGMYSAGQPAADVFNKLRQKHLAMEKSYVNKKGVEARFFIHGAACHATNTFLGALLTPLGYEKYSITSMTNFIEALAKQLMLNPMRDDLHRSRCRVFVGWQKMLRKVEDAPDVNAPATPQASR